MTPQTHAQLACGGKVRIAVTLAADGSEVADLTATVLAVDGRGPAHLLARTDNGDVIRIPLPAAPAAVLPLPRPLRGAR